MPGRPLHRARTPRHPRHEAHPGAESPHPETPSATLTHRYPPPSPPLPPPPTPARLSPASQHSFSHYCILFSCYPCPCAPFVFSDYEFVYRLVEDFPHLKFTLNGGVLSLDEAVAHLGKGVHGVMVGRAAYKTPWPMLRNVDSALCNPQQHTDTHTIHPRNTPSSSVHARTCAHARARVPSARSSALSLSPIRTLR